MAWIFAELAVDEVHAAVAARWDLSGPLPTPRDGWLRCPVCAAQRLQIRHWHWHTRDNATVPHRCDVAFKCADCSAVWLHGVPVPPDYWYRNATAAARVGWRDGRRMLEEHRGQA